MSDLVLTMLLAGAFIALVSDRILPAVVAASLIVFIGLSAASLAHDLTGEAISPLRQSLAFAIGSAITLFGVACLEHRVAWLAVPSMWVALYVLWLSLELSGYFELNRPATLTEYWQQATYVYFPTLIAVVALLNLIVAIGHQVRSFWGRAHKA